MKHLNIDNTTCNPFSIDMERVAEIRANNKGDFAGERHGFGLYYVQQGASVVPLSKKGKGAISRGELEQYLTHIQHFLKNRPKVLDKVVKGVKGLLSQIGKDSKGLKPSMAWRTEDAIDKYFLPDSGILAFANFNIGLAHGFGGTIAYDIDNKMMKAGPFKEQLNIGDQSIQRLLAENEVFVVEGPTQKTASGVGYQVICLNTDGIPSGDNCMLFEPTIKEIKIAKATGSEIEQERTWGIDLVGGGKPDKAGDLRPWKSHTPVEPSMVDGNKYKWTGGGEAKPLPRWVINKRIKRATFDGGDSVPARALTITGIGRGNANIGEGDVYQDEPYTPEQLKELMFATHPDQLEDYLEGYFAQISAFHSSFDNDADRADAMGVAIEWAKQGSRYEEGEIEKRWGGFKADKVKGNGIGTLVRNAETYCKLNESKLSKWAGTDFTAKEWNRDCRQQEATGVVKFDFNAGSAKFINVKNVGDLQKIHALGIPVDDIVDEFNKHCVEMTSNEGGIKVFVDSRFLTTKENMEYLASVNDLPDHYRSMSPNAFVSNAEEYMGFNIEGERCFINMAQIWMLSPRRNKAIKHKMFHDPKVMLHGCLNMWSGYAVDPVEGKGVASFIKHITDHVCRGNKEHANWLLHHFAHTIQYPMDPVGTALVFKGPEGCGKGFAFNITGSLMGRHFVPFQTSQHFFGQFNSIMAYSNIMLLDEMTYGGNKTEGGAIKSLISEEDVMTEQKYCDKQLVKRCYVMWFSSNEAWVIPVDLDEDSGRRFAVFDVLKYNFVDEAAKNAFWKPMWDYYNSKEGKQALLYYFLNFKLDPTINLESVPDTFGKDQQRGAAYPAATDFKLHSIFVDQKAMPVIETASGTVCVTKKDMYKAYKHFVRSEHSSDSYARLSSNIFYTVMKPFNIYVDKGLKRKMDPNYMNGKPQAFVIMKPLEELRKDMAERYPNDQRVKDYLNAIEEKEHVEEEWEPEKASSFMLVDEDFKNL